MATLIQPAILLSLACMAGTVLAPRVGLRAPLVEAWREGAPLAPLLPALAPATIVIGVLASLLILGFGLLTRQALGSLAEAWPGVPLVTRLLYGGNTEEVLLRWGLMTLLVWLAARLAGGNVGAGAVWAGILGAALLFGAGHLPLLFVVMATPPAWLVAGVIVGNAIPGIGFGWLFWRHGLEAAMLAHMSAHALAWLLELVVFPG